MPKPKAGLKNYMNEIENVIIESIDADENDGLDVQTPDRFIRLPVVPDPKNVFFEQLLMRLENLAQPQAVSVVVTTTEAHVERLLTVEKSMFAVMNDCVECVKSSLKESRGNLKEEIKSSNVLIEGIMVTQRKIVETQVAMIGAIAALSVKISEMTANQPAPVVNVPAPIINIPAPVVNINETNRRVTKSVERNDVGLITKVIEDSSD
jgi:hypothetical protein